jgi:HEAT repeat protein
VILVLLDLIPQRKPDIAALKRKHDIPGLINALSSRDPDVQSDAVHGLGDIGPAAVGQLITALRRRNRRLRLGAIGALAEIKDTGAVSALAGMMKDPVSEIRWQAAIALGETGSPEAVAPLLQGLEDRDKYVRYGAAISLIKNGYQPPADADRAWYYAAMQDWDRLQALGPAALAPVDNLLRDTDSEVRVRAVRILGGIGDPGSGPVIIRMLADPDRQVRWEAALASQKCGVPPMYLPRGLCRRPRIQKNPLVAGFLNFLLPGLGYGYLGKWWGIMIFQIELSVTLWLYQTETTKYGRDVGEFYTYTLLFPLYFLLAIHAWYLAKNMPEEPA